MPLPQVLNKRWSPILPDSVYVGRPSKWGNPFSHLDKGSQAQFKVKTREEAVQAFEAYLLKLMEKNPALLYQLRKELGGKNLVCWCAPAKCHAEVLIKYANPLGEESVENSSQSESELSNRESDATSPQPDGEDPKDGEETIQQTNGS